MDTDSPGTVLTVWYVDVKKRASQGEVTACSKALRPEGA